MADWLFVSNHALVLLCVARDPTMRLRDIGDYVGITERAAHRIVSELVDAGYLKRTRDGTRNRYDVALDQPMRHPLLGDRSVGELIELYTSEPKSRTPRPERRRSPGRRSEDHLLTRVAPTDRADSGGRNGSGSVSNGRESDAPKAARAGRSS
jgi:MarR family